MHYLLALIVGFGIVSCKFPTPLSSTRLPEMPAGQIGQEMPESARELKILGRTVYLEDALLSSDCGSFKSSHWTSTPGQFCKKAMYFDKSPRADGSSWKLSSLDSSVAYEGTFDGKAGTYTVQGVPHYCYSFEGAIFGRDGQVATFTKLSFLVKTEASRVGDLYGEDVTILRHSSEKVCDAFYE